MDLRDTRKIIVNSPYSKKLGEIEIEVEFSSIKQSFNLKGLYNIYKFFFIQNNGWGTKQSPKFNTSISFFESAINNLDNYINSSVLNKEYSEELVLPQWNSYTTFLKPSKRIFTFDAPEVDFLLTILEQSPNSFDAAHNYIIDAGITLSSKDTFQGVIMAYEFQNKENSYIYNKRENNKKFISKMRSEIETLSNDYQNELTSHIKQTTDDYTDYKNKLDEFEKNSTDSLSQWMITHKGEFETFHKHSEKQIEALENQYSELLKLQEPVKYWKDRGIELNAKANNMLWLVVGITFIGVISTYILLWFTPEGMLSSIFKGDTTSAIRWSIIFAIFISFIAFLIRAVMKYMFSNYHLARDAEEREKLTYLYVSLLNKGEFSEDERKIVLQALFSRSDTGLLKEDSSPTMPGISSIFDKR